MVGIGAQGDFELAKDFVASTGTTFTMLWSESVDAWRYFTVLRESDVWVIDKLGNRVNNSSTPFDESHIYKHLAALS